MKRIPVCQSSDFRTMNRQELLAAIAGSEGRTIACETIGSIMPTLGDITNAEFVTAMGADILLLTLFYGAGSHHWKGIHIRIRFSENTCCHPQTDTGIIGLYAVH